MANNLIGCWGSPAANQIIRHSNPIFSITSSCPAYTDYKTERCELMLVVYYKTVVLWYFCLRINVCLHLDFSCSGTIGSSKYHYTFKEIHLVIKTDNVEDLKSLL